MTVFPSERGETPGEGDVTASGHKQQNWKVQTGRSDGAVLPVNNSCANISPTGDLNQQHLSPAQQEDMSTCCRVQVFWE